MLFLCCSLVLGTCQPIPAAPVNGIFSTENGLILKTFWNCSPWISSGWCDCGWTNAEGTRNLQNRSGFGGVKETQLNAEGTYIHPYQPMHELGFMIHQFMKRQPLKIFLCKVWSFSLSSFFSPFNPLLKAQKWWQEYPAAILLQSQSSNQRNVTIRVGTKCMQWGAIWNKNVNLLAFQKKNLFPSTGNTMERKLESTLLGWAFTLICSSWLRL